MAILHSWATCPEKYKKLAPFTQHFFDEGGKVLLVMAIDSKANKEDLKALLENQKTEHTDEVSLNLGDYRLRVFYWTQEGKKRVHKPR